MQITKNVLFLSCLEAKSAPVAGELSGKTDVL